MASNLTVGTYTATVTDQNGCTKSISVDVMEPLALSPVIDTIIPPICYGGLGSASVVVSGGTSPYNFAWSPSNDTTNFASTLLAGTNTVTCTDANGCTATAIAIVTQPLQVVTVSSGNDTICLGQSVTLSATATGGAGNYYFAWQPSSAINGGTLPVTPTSDMTYYVVAFDQTGCEGVPTTIDVKVYSLDSSNIKAYATTPICLGNSSDVYVETFGNTGALSYSWSNGLGTGTGLYSVTPVQNTNYVITITNSCGLTISDSVMVYITTPPSVDIRPDSNVLCTPGTMFFTDSSLAGNPNDPITSWTWDFGDGTSSALENPSHIYNLAGTYQVTLTVSSTKGCVNSNASAPVIITGIPAPTAAFTVTATQLHLPNDVLNINNQTTGASTYNWTFGDGGSSTLMNPQYLYETIGIFQVQLIAMAQNGCLDTATLQVTTDADVIFPTAFTPSPDGTTGGHYNINDYHNDIFFPFTSGVVDFKLEIYDRWGELIFVSTDIKQGWDGYYRGVICQQDVYVFKAYVKLNNGKEVNKIGNVTLLR
jgi:gliding motility-associated-like protein